MKKVTRKQAEKVLDAIKKQFASYVEDGYAPDIHEGWDGPGFWIIWESGSPFEWALHAFQDHLDEELYHLSREAGATDEEARTIASVKSVPQPKGVWCEAVNEHVLAILRDE